MTDRIQMKDDIERALSANRPGPEGTKPTNIHVFPVTVLFSNLFEPQSMKFDKDGPKYYTVSFPAADLPKDLVASTSVRDWKGVPVITSRCRVAPVIVPTLTSRCALDTTINCAKYNNITGDRMLRDARIELCVEAVQYETMNPFNRGWICRMNRELQLRAVRINVDAMVSTYDEIMAALSEDFDQ